ncbi:MAG: sensor histidine kinase [Betaproteobacteria bacterium]|nr:sensor histidine kinase [Betaproteobacteria bacterium]
MVQHRDSGHLLNTSRRNLERLWILRWIALGAMTATVAIARHVLGEMLDVGALAGCLGAGLVLNAWTTWRLRGESPVRETEIFLQLLGDTAVLSGVLYFSGGWANPFASVFLLPLVIAATLLPPRLTWVLALVTFAAYTGLGFWYVPLPHMHHGMTSDFDLHVFGMWVSFVLSAAVVAYFVTRMAVSLRERDRELAAERERTLRDQHVLSLGTLAAGAAHQLGTPLATIAVMLRELQLERAGDGELAHELAAIRGQVDQCKAIISDLVATAGQTRAEGGRMEPVDRFLESTVENWRALRPGISIATTLAGSQPPPRILADQTLGHTLVTLLNNAADASRDGVELAGTWTPGQLTVEIRDKGAGVPESVLRAAGWRPLTTKASGHGVGLLIANAALERFGGKVTLANRHDGGACTRLELPLERLAA